MRVFRNIEQLATLEKAWVKGGRNLLPEDIGIIEQAALVFDDEKILWVGKDKDLPAKFAKGPSKDLSNHCVTPQIVDSHTHTIFGGERAQEYSWRLDGLSYEEIAKRGGGILTTMQGTNELNASQLFDLCIERVTRIASYGVGTLEIKSGYGLNYEKERELSQIIHQLKQHFEPRIKIINTFMAAHAVPKSYKDSREYLDQIVLPLLNELAPLGIIDFVDIFHEQNYFNNDDVKALFKVAQKYNIKTKIHADEFNDNGGAQLGVEQKSHSVDHLLSISQEGITALANSNTVATLLPGTGLFLGMEQAPGKKLLDAGAKVAMASDYNPGSCHYDNLVQIAAMSAPLFKMNMAQIWSAITLNAAGALGLHNQGALVCEREPRFSIFKVDQISKISYYWGHNFFKSFD